MATNKLVQQAKAALTVSGLATLAHANYTVSNAYDCSVNSPVDVLIEVNVATTNTTSTNRQVLCFVQASLDGTNFTSGPTSGSSATDEPDLLLNSAGYMPVVSSTTTHTAVFSLFATLGYIPKAFRVVFKNDTSVALTSASVNTAEIWAQSA